MDPLDPRFEEWLLAQHGQTAATAAPRAFDDVGFDEAAAADRAARAENARAQMFGGVSEMMAPRYKSPPVPGPDDSRLKEWVLKDKLRRDSNPKAKPADPLADLRGEKLRLEVDRLKNTPAEDVLEPEIIARSDSLGIPTKGRKREAVVADILQRENAREGRAAALAAAREGRSVTAPVRDAATAREERAAAGATYGGKYFKLRADVPPGSLDEVELRKVRDASGEVADMAAAADELSGIYKRTGGTIVGEDAARMRSLVTDLQLAAKGPNVYALGVLAGPDMEILSTMIPDPTKLQGILQNKVALRDFLAQVETFKRRMVERMSSKADALGFDPVAGPFVGARRPGGPASKRPQRTVNGETREWNGSAWVAPGSP